MDARDGDGPTTPGLAPDAMAAGSGAGLPLPEAAPILSRRRFLRAAALTTATAAGGSAWPAAARQDADSDGAAGERSLDVRRVGDAVVVAIDGVPVDAATVVRTRPLVLAETTDGSGGGNAEPTGGGPGADLPDSAVYLSHYLPFEAFPTPEAMGRSLVAEEGRLWALTGVPATPAAGVGHHGSADSTTVFSGPAEGPPGGPVGDVVRFARASRQVGPDVRVNVYDLGRRDWRRLVAALDRAKRSGAYDEFTVQHLRAMGTAHKAPTFAPWHRWYLRRFEVMLQAFVPGVTVPYWDWEADGQRPDPALAPLWTADFLGGDGDPGDGDRVADGPFAGWVSRIPAVDGSTVERPGILRTLGRLGGEPRTLPAPFDVAFVMDQPAYDIAPYDVSSAGGFRNWLEGWAPVLQSRPSGMHNRVHLWVGGDMVSAASPNDPAFWLHHANVDRLWLAWQERHPTAGYQPTTGGPAGQNLDDDMGGFGDAGVDPVSPSATLDPVALGYVYAPSQ